MKKKSQYSQSGFTLVELMVVIVIVGILASLIFLNISGVDKRKAMQSRDFFLLDLQKINKESIDQGRVFALITHPETNVNPFGYELVEYFDQSQNAIIDEKKKWQKYQDFQIRNLPPTVGFSVESLDQENQNATNQDLIGNQAPKMIWYGNGEVRPVRIQFYYDQQPIGDVIEVDHLGKINES